MWDIHEKNIPILCHLLAWQLVHAVLPLAGLSPSDPYMVVQSIKSLMGCYSLVSNWVVGEQLCGELMWILTYVGSPPFIPVTLARNSHTKGRCITNWGKSLHWTWTERYQDTAWLDCFWNFPLWLIPIPPLVKGGLPAHKFQHRAQAMI